MRGGGGGGGGDTVSGAGGRERLIWASVARNEVEGLDAVIPIERKVLSIVSLGTH